MKGNISAARSKDIVLQDGKVDKYIVIIALIYRDAV